MRILLLTLSVACIMLILHDIGIRLFLYWTIAWFDLFMHGIGGFVIGGLLFFFFEHRPLFLYSTSFVALVCWELFEVFIVRIPVGGMPYVTDTVSDVLIGIAGVTLARLLLRRL